MRRREFITLFGGAVGWPLTARAQQPVKVARIGYLITAGLESPEARVFLEVMRQRLTELGYVEGQNIIIELRGADSKIERLPGLAAELVGLKVDVIVAGASPGGHAARQATTTIPIVVNAMGDPVRDGLVASLARPGGNITGTTFLGPELVPKRFALLKELLPKISHVTALSHPGAFTEQTTEDMQNEAVEAAGILGLHLRFVEVRGPNELERAFSMITRERDQAIFQLPSTMFFAERKRIVDLAAMRRLPAMYNAREFVQLKAALRPHRYW